LLTPSTNTPRTLNLFYTDHHHFPLPEGHKFPLEKYRLLRETLSTDARFQFHAAPFLAEQDLLRVHQADYVDGFLRGTLERQSMRRIGFPWSPQLVHRTLASAGATLAATRLALETGFGGTLAGGTHHAFRAEGAGFCVFNDLAIAIEWARAHTGLTRFAVVDCDVHQGDGTAAIFQNDPGVFTLSLHGARNFPFRKQKSTLDVELPDAADDEAYLQALASALPPVWQFEPQLVLYQSGVDALLTDRLGHLNLTAAGLLRRDQLVISQTYWRGVPLVITLGGGYSEPIMCTVQAHAQTFRTAADVLLDGCA
jgi:acetoin utilization deacetylase AcuC-like enzyme